MNDNNPKLDAIILAAGKGTRMHSDLPKVMHEVAGRPMINWVIDASRKAVELATSTPEQVSALMQSAIHRRELGQVREAVEDCERAIALSPKDPGNYTNKLLFMLADPTVTADQLAHAAREFGAVFEPSLKPQWPSFESHRGTPWQRLKIGFLSPDFRVHSVMYFVEGLLAQLDRRQFEVFAFFLFSGKHRTCLQMFVRKACGVPTSRLQKVSRRDPCNVRKQRFPYWTQKHLFC